MKKWVPMFSCVFVTVTVVDEDLCWFGHDNKRIRYILGTCSTCIFYHQHCSPNLHANFCNLGKFTFILMATKIAQKNSINGHWKTLKYQCI